MTFTFTGRLSLFPGSFSITVSLLLLENCVLFPPLLKWNHKSSWLLNVWGIRTCSFIYQFVCKYFKYSYIILFLLINDWNELVLFMCFKLYASHTWCFFCDQSICDIYSFSFDQIAVNVFNSCLLMTALHTLGILSTSFTWNDFSNSLEEVPTYAEHLLAAFPSLCGPTHPKPIEFRWLWRLGHLMQHSITFLLCQNVLKQPGGGLGHCPVEIQMIVPISANQMGWRIAVECCGSHAG